MAGLVTAPRTETERLEASVIVAAMQTLERHRQLDLGPVALVVIDEAHHAVATIWRRVLARFDGARPTRARHRSADAAAADGSRRSSGGEPAGDAKRRTGRDEPAPWHLDEPAGHARGGDDEPPLGR